MHSNSLFDRPDASPPPVQPAKRRLTTRTRSGAESLRIRKRIISVHTDSSRCPLCSRSANTAGREAHFRGFHELKGAACGIAGLRGRRYGSGPLCVSGATLRAPECAADRRCGQGNRRSTAGRRNPAARGLDRTPRRGTCTRERGGHVAIMENRLRMTCGRYRKCPLAPRCS